MSTNVNHLKGFNMFQKWFGGCWWLIHNFLFRGSPFGRCLRLASPGLLQMGVARGKRFAMPPWLSKLGNSRHSQIMSNYVKLCQIAYHGWHDDTVSPTVCVCVYGGFHCFWLYILFGTPIKVPFGCLSAVSLTVVCSKGLSIQMLAAATLANVTSISTVRRLFGARHCRIVPKSQHRKHNHWMLLW
jgi:hypothetical protein